MVGVVAMNVDCDDEFAREHAKRDRHITPELRQAWANTLLQMLPQSEAYQAACTPTARKAEERRLLAQNAQWRESTGEASD